MSIPCSSLTCRAPNALLPVILHVPCPGLSPGCPGDLSSTQGASLLWAQLLSLAEGHTSHLQEAATQILLCFLEEPQKDEENMQKRDMYQALN